MTQGRIRRLAALLIIGLAAASGMAVHAENTDPDDDGSQYGWSENAGWVNAEPNGDGADGVEVSDFELTGWMWGENFGWISLSCQNTSSCGTTDYGVANDGMGMLSGYAWSENGGWFNFAPSTSGVSIDANTGEFGGYAWSENMGWVSFSCTNTGTCGTTDYGVKTDWCQSVAAAPVGMPDIDASRNGDDVELTWTGVATANWYEIVRGRLSNLLESGGDYSTATGECPADNETATAVVVAGTPAPEAGDGYWYLVRGANCKGQGTYESGGAQQIGLRDAEIAGSGLDCP